ncbi:MAG: hypothetical protein EOP73_15405 [Variovorax sp.]|nr:MAG: hypothetical protein EOP73_15405 [Variovorax sp.]
MADRSSTPRPPGGAGSPVRRAARHAVVLVVLLAAVMVLASAGQRRWQEHRQAELGERLLQGDDGSGGRPAGAGAADVADLAGDAPVLRGRLAGHPDDLPPAATRCVNCHAIGEAPGRPATATFGPLLGPATLAWALPRRGGPPSRYDAASLCRLLREGIDPAWVMVDAAMPRYAVSDAQCEALWARLAGPSRS